MNTIITIGRQFGSGGREIGLKLAEIYNIPFYDKEILARASKESGLCQELIEQNDEKGAKSFFYSLVMGASYMGYTNANPELNIGQKIFLAQFDSIKKIANEGPCVIVGRCSDYVLEEYTNCVNVFIHADLSKRCKKIMKSMDLSEKKALDLIVKTDKERMSYYNYHTNRKWGDMNNYNLTIDSSMLGIDGSVEIIKNFIDLKEKKL